MSYSLSLQFCLHNNLCLLKKGAMCRGSTLRGCCELLWAARPWHITLLQSPSILWLVLFPEPLCFGLLVFKPCTDCVVLTFSKPCSQTEGVF